MSGDESTKLSVVIPVRNGSGTLAMQLGALVAAEHPGVPFEVVVADNGSTDGSAAIARGFVGRLPIRVVDAGRRPGSNVARNDGAASGTAPWIIMCDADDEVDTWWIRRMTEALAEGHQLIAGTVDYVRLNTPEQQTWLGVDRVGVALHVGYLQGGHGSNMGFTRELFEHLGGFDEGFSGGGDETEFFFRAQLAGYELYEVTEAIVYCRIRSTLRGLWRQYVGYGRSEAHLYRNFSAHGMRRRPMKHLRPELWWQLSRLPLLLQPEQRGRWLRPLGRQWGRFVGAVRYRTLWW